MIYYKYKLSFRRTGFAFFPLLLIITGCSAIEVVQAPVGEDITLPCPFIYGLEEVELLQWMRIDEWTERLAELNGQGRIYVESPKYNVSSNLDLLIKNVSLADAGLYRCLVSHKDIRVSLTANDVALNTYAQDTREVLLGDDVHITCSHPSLNVEGFKYSISWARQTQILSTGHNLTIRNFSIGDVGRYQCNSTPESDAMYIAHQTVLTTTGKD
ncbi:hemolin-like [Diadema antillarum]|uniref:hemolin-like n=1 Tax=Diadema antillarum TaxID=105358 RepID=UPI003A85636B